jgi:hypothetical protein
MRLLDAVIAVACSDVAEKWQQYEVLADRILPVADAAREMFKRARLRGGYDTTMRWVNPGREVYEASALEEIFLTAFVAAVHAGRCSVWGVPRGESTTTMIDPVLITLAAFKGVRGNQQWELAGTVWFGVDVIVGPPPISKLRPASDREIHDAIKVHCEHCRATGQKIPNEKEIGEPVRTRLHGKGFDASLSQIQRLFKDPRYDGLRLKPGEHWKAGKTLPKRS